MIINKRFLKIFKKRKTNSIKKMGCSGMKGLCTGSDTKEKEKPEKKDKPKRKDSKSSSSSGSSHGSGKHHGHGRGRGHHKGGPGGPGGHHH